jgi:phosphohistidine phosphatase
LRHGDAGERGDGSDFQRPLTERGQRQARAAGSLLARLDVPFEHVFTSPRVRALDTARLACAALGIEPVVHEPLQGEFSARDAAELIAATADDRALLLVGHEPDLSGLVRAFADARVELKKGGLAAVRLGSGRGELVLLLRPNEIELVGEL